MLVCFHCGDEVQQNPILHKDKQFCCLACKNVFEILSIHNLDNYYNIDAQAGINPQFNKQHDFSYLDENSISVQLLTFNDSTISLVKFKLPSIHCSSCVWLLENLHRLNSGIKKIVVNFTKKEATIHFHHQEIRLSDLAHLLQKIGYKPEINLDDLNKIEVKNNNKLLYQIAVAGFAFGNIMFLGFTEYFDAQKDMPNDLLSFFGWIAFSLSMPVVFYSARDYFISAWRGLTNKFINIDTPISLGIIALFIQSIYEVYTLKGLGYFDSLSGLVFFLLLGKMFQNKTYQKLSFDRDYKSYFPISIIKIIGENEKPTSITEINIGDLIRVKNEEIIPCDSILIDKESLIDNSFITGESKEIEAKKGDQIYAGAKNIGKSILLKVKKEVSQSYLTQLWNQDSFKKEQNSINSITDKISKYFTLSILSISCIAFFFWLGTDQSKAIYVLSSVLIVACPCALALSAPFTLGNTLRIFGNAGFYLKNSQVIEQIAKISHIAFDKTGTITQKTENSVTYTGEPISIQNKIYLNTLTKQSSHPLSNLIQQYLNCLEGADIQSYKEVIGKGISASINNTTIKLGSAEFMGIKTNSNKTKIFLKINNVILGYFQIEHVFRKNLGELFCDLSQKYKLSILSGDHNNSKADLAKLLPDTSDLLFNQKPVEKLKYIQNEQKNHKKIMMIGDGLNDAGALKQSDVGISICEDINKFTPASDGILDAKSFPQLSKFILLTNDSMNIIKASFIISWAYNIVGLCFAIQGLLSPVVAAILMPLSSISVVLFTSVGTKFMAHYRGISSC